MLAPFTIVSSLVSLAAFYAAYTADAYDVELLYIVCMWLLVLPMDDEGNEEK